MTIDKKKTPLRFEKYQKIHSFKFSVSQSSFNYNEKTLNRIRLYFQNGLVDKLVDLKLLTPSFFSKDDNQINKFKLLQPDFETPSFFYELTPGMKKEAAKLILNLSLELGKHNLMIAEGSLTRIFFNKNRQPFFYDIAGIVETKGFGFYYSTFKKYYFNGLKIIHLKPHLINLIQPLDKIEFSDYITICSPVKYKMLNVFFWLIGKTDVEVKLTLFNNSPAMSLLTNLRLNLIIKYCLKFLKINRTIDKNISELIIKDLKIELDKMDRFDITQKWTDYYKNINFVKIIQPNQNLVSSFKNERENAILKLISNSKYKTLLDIGANGGYFSIISGLVGLKTTAIDNDVGALELLYKNLNQNKSLPILPVVKSFTSLTQGELIRFKSDVVLALGFLHHMRLVELMSWELIAERLYGLTNKILIIEFKPDTNASGANDWEFDEALNDYSSKSLVNAFSEFFSTVKKIGEFSALGSKSKRLMFVCKV